MELQQQAEADKVAGVRRVFIVVALWVCLEWGAQVHIPIEEEAGEEGGGWWGGGGLLTLVEVAADLSTVLVVAVRSCKTTKVYRQATD